MNQKLDLLIGMKEQNLSELLKYHSTRNDFDVNTFTATSGEQLRQKINDHNYSGIITDYDLVDENAIDILIEEDIDVPFIIHTWYHNNLLEKKALNEGASAMLQKKKHLSYFNKVLYMVSEISDSFQLQKTERKDIKFRISSDGSIIQMNGVPRELSENTVKISDISRFMDPGQVEEAIEETLELGDSTLEAVIEDGKGLANYRLCFTKLENRPGISVTGIPMEELQYIEKEFYPGLSKASGEGVTD